MTRTRAKTKKLTRSRRSRSTKRSNASTLTSRARPGSAAAAGSASAGLASAHKSVQPATKRSANRSDQRSANRSDQRSANRQHRAQKLANELYSRSLRPRPSNEVQEAVVEGVSMWPALRPGYRIRYRSVPPDSLSPGDLLVLRSIGRRGERHWRVHRLIGRVGPYFVEAGDNAFSAALVRPGDILGRVEGVRDWSGKTVKLAKPERPEEMHARFKYFLWCAHGFMFAHECKDRLLGGRRSLMLWRMSQLYRAGLGTLGLKVPAIPPA